MFISEDSDTDNINFVSISIQESIINTDFEDTISKKTIIKNLKPYKKLKSGCSINNFIKNQGFRDKIRKKYFCK